MKKAVRTSTSNTPEAHITQRKQRVKQHKSNHPLLDGYIYLNDGDNYEIELFNTKPVHVLAKIKIDGEYLSGGGIVLRPGERVFLERFLDSNNKFVFRTYEVDGEAIELGATENNGVVEIGFYTEQQSLPYSISTYPITYAHNGGSTINLNANNVHTTGTPTHYSGTTFTTSGTTTAFYNNNLSATNTSAGPNIRSAKIETGTTEKGDVSTQQFTQSYRNFDMHVCEIVKYHILPNSQKQYRKEDLGILYCGNCGSKRKKDTHKFCPHCGTKF